MDKVLVIIVTIIIAVILFMNAGERYQNAAAEREYARAAMVREQSQARSDLMAGALPYVAITFVGVFGAVTMAIVVIVSVRWLGDDRARRPQHIIERHTTVLILPEGQTRRMMWQRLADSERKMIGGGDETV